jgi:hypothetical protein
MREYLCQLLTKQGNNNHNIKRAQKSKQHKPNHSVSNWAAVLKRQFKKEEIQRPIAYKEVFNICSHKGNANQTTFPNTKAGWLSSTNNNKCC